MSQLNQKIPHFLVEINTPNDAITNPTKSIDDKFCPKNNQAIDAVTIGIKKNNDTVLLAEFFCIRYIKIENAPKETKNT